MTHRKTTVRKRLFAIFLPILILFALGATYTFWPLSVQLNDWKDAGKGYDVTILRDTWGVPHIFGKTDPDTAFGLAYAHAEDDFLTNQQTLIAARGRLATVYGQDGAPNDYMVGFLRIWDVVNNQYDEDLSPDSKQLFEAYADGINTYAALHPDEVISPDLFPISGKDVVAASVHKSPLFFGLEKTLAELFRDPQANLGSAPVVFTAPVGFDTQYGSNTLAVSPSRSSDGSTFLAVNSHQPWQGPQTWYEAHVHSEQGWNMVGALFPATPVIIHGHNEDLGWAFTVNNSDLVDIYTLEMNPDNPNQYRFDGEWLDLEVRQIPLEVKLLGRIRITVNREALWSVYGPTVRRSDGVFAIRYAGFGRVDIFQQLYRMNKARNFEEWQTAMREGGLPTFNVGYADREGNIYYLYNGMIPVRAEGYDWSGNLPGNTFETLWTEYLPFEQLPQVLNPPAGFIQNANSTPFITTIGDGNPDKENYSPTLGIDSRVSNRALRALELFGADDSITFDEFYQYKFDQRYSDQSDIASFVDTLVNENFSANPDLTIAQDILKHWDLRATPDSAGMTLAYYTHYYLVQNKQPVSGSTMYGHTVEPEAVVEAFIQAVQALKDKFGQVDVPWQNVNRLRRGNTDLGLGGGPDLLNAVYGGMQEDGTLTGFQGDSYVLLVSWDANGNLTSSSIHQYGSATLDASSPHYADQAELFVHRELKPVWFTESAIRDHLEREYSP